MKKTFEFTEQQAELLRKEQYKYLINDNMDHFLFLVQQIVSERITTEPGESIKPYHEHGNSVASDRTEPGGSGQSAEDVLKSFGSWNGLWNEWAAQRSERDGFFEFRKWVEINYHTPISFASQVCADKDEIIKERELEILSLTYDKDKEIDRLNESLTVIVRKNAELEKEVKEAYDKGVSVGRRDI